MEGGAKKTGSGLAVAQERDFVPAVRDKHTPVPLSKLFTAPPAIRLLLVPRGRAARPVYDENAADAAERCCEPARRPPDAAASARPGPDPAWMGPAGPSSESWGEIILMLG